VERPTLVPMRQELDNTRIDDFEATLARKIRDHLATASFNPGDTVALGVGSRGVTPLVAAVSTIVRELKAAGLEPFIVPAMGSHGGATPEGQEAVLAEYRITESVVGAPIRATMDTVVTGKGPRGFEYLMDANAYGADHVAVLGRVKPHTDFHGDIESGLCKMTAVGFGKQKGAERIHQHGLAESIPESAQVAVDTGKILMGVAMVENPLDEPAYVEVVGGDRFHATDRALLAKARTILPVLPADALHMLIVDEMGKNISGAGMDTNVIGLFRLLGEGPRTPDYRYITTLRLTPESNGNATGIGMADLVTQKLVDDMNPDYTYMNCLTSMTVQGARVPMTLPTDQAAIDTGLGLARRAAGSDTPIMARITNTMELQRFHASEPLAEQLEAAGSATRDGDPVALQFTPAGDLADLNGG
jgi:hypothetical protein